MLLYTGWGVCQVFLNLFKNNKLVIETYGFYYVCYLFSDAMIPSNWAMIYFRNKNMGCFM